MPIACSLCTLPIVRPVVVNTCPACGDDVHSDCLNQHIRQKHARAFDVWTQGLDATPCLRRLASVAAAASEPSSLRAPPKKLVNRSWTRAEAEEAHRYNTAKRQAKHIVRKVTEHMLVKLLVKQDAVLNDLSRGWTRLRAFGSSTENIDALRDRRIKKLIESIEDEFAEANGEVLVCVKVLHRRSAR